MYLEKGVLNCLGIETILQFEMRNRREEEGVYS